MTPAAASPTLVDAFLADRDRAARTAWLVTLVIIGTIAITISAKINIPFWPVPMTMQTFVITVIGLAYGWRLGGATVALYLAEGAVGIPVFAGGGGLLYMAGPTGGYLAGFLVAAAVLGLLAERGWGRDWLTTIVAMTIGTAIIFVFGVGYLSTLIGFEEALVGGFVPFIWGSVFKIALAAAVMPFAWRLVDARTPH